MRVIQILLGLSLVATAVIYSLPRTWELDLIAGLQASSTTGLVHFLQFISDSISYVSIGIPVLILVTGFVTPQKTLRKKALLVLFSIALAGMLSYSLKKLVREPRPYEVDIRISQWSGGGGYGFPSGHTVEAVAAATAFFLLWPEWPVFAAAFAWALLIMFSRVYLGVHDPGDVSAGMFLGILSALIVLKAGDSIKRRKGQTP